jgi:nucleotide-binding universal stress UspA family protein
VTMVVGFAPDQNDPAPLHLAALLARSASDRLVVATVVTSAWPANPRRFDAEHRAYQEQSGQPTLLRAKAHLAADVDATFVLHNSRSAAGGLLEVAERQRADYVVLGSSPSESLGRVALGGVTNRIVHSSHIPVAIAPGSYRCGKQATVQRVTTAFGRSSGIHDLIIATASVAARIGASMRIASFTVRPPHPFAGQLANEGDSLVTNEWIKHVSAEIRNEFAAVRDLPEVPEPLEVAVGHGVTWTEALEDATWMDGDVLVVGSSMTGPAARVFLGSRASKILRHSPVPVVLVPRSTADEVGARR